MGRVKLQIRRIENNNNRQVTFSKRRNGLVKKAYELSVLCDIDVALLMFSPAGRLTHFSGRRHGVEDVVLRYMNLPERDREEAIQNREGLIGTLQRLKREGDVATQLANPGAALNEKIEEVQREIYACQQQLHVAEEHLRLFEPAADPSALGSTSEIDGCEKFLTDVLARVVERKNYLLSNHMAPLDTTARPGIKAEDASQMFVQPEQVEGTGTFAGDAALWFAHHDHDQMFGSSDPMVYLRDQDVYDATSQVTGLHGEPPFPTGAGGVEGDADAWRMEYTCTELLSTLIHSEPFPLMPHCLGLLGPDDQFLPMEIGGGGMETMGAAQEQVEASTASCSYVPSNDSGTPVTACDSTAAPANGAGGADPTT